eukprot:3370332-Rhodomonas_salina.1
MSEKALQGAPLDTKYTGLSTTLTSPLIPCGGFVSFHASVSALLLSTSCCVHLQLLVSLCKD